MGRGRVIRRERGGGVTLRWAMMSETSRETIGIVVVDHGSRREASNQMLIDVAALFEKHTDWPIVEPAHMELAEPSIATAYDRCVERGATLICVNPYFLAPGKHWHEDIPNLTAAAAARHPQTRFLVTAPLGLHPQMASIMDSRIEHCLAHADGEAEECDVCRGTGRCRVREGAAVTEEEIAAAEEG